jgi:AmiR/NasT family two-component response regulator
VTVFLRVAASTDERTSAVEEETINGQLQYAIDSRALIEQAKDKLAQHHGIPIDEAFVLLRTYARSENMKLHDAADNVVNYGVTLGMRLASLEDT